MSEFTRRDSLRLAAGAGAALPLFAGACASKTATPLSSDHAPLKGLAAAKGLRFGTAMSARQLLDPDYAALVQRECAVIVAENEHKQYTILAEPDLWNFAPADALVGFAKDNGLAMRGHTLLWNRTEWMPDWLNAQAFKSAAEAETWLGGYITRVAGRYDPFLSSWDVVNETIDPETGALRETVFSKAMGPELIDYCFHVAREAAPGAMLAYNDYMSWEANNENHRAGVLRLLERLKKNDVPIDALGIQSHSNYDMPNEFTADKQRAWRGFVDEVVSMGLDIYLTEFDVNDTDLGPDAEMRDALIASYTKDYLDMMLAYEETKDLLVWGLVDSQSWLQGFLPRTDGVEKRPSPFDSLYRPKPMRAAIAAALESAPAR